MTRREEAQGNPSQGGVVFLLVFSLPTKRHPTATWLVRLLRNPGVGGVPFEGQPPPKWRERSGWEYKPDMAI